MLFLLRYFFRYLINWINIGKECGSIYYQCISIVLYLLGSKCEIDVNLSQYFGKKSKFLRSHIIIIEVIAQLSRLL